MFCFLLVLPSAGVSGHKLTFFLIETLYLWGRNKFELRCTHIWCFFKYIYIKLWSNKLTFSLSSCVRWAAVPEVSSPHSPETHPSRLRSASLLNVHLFSVKRPHPSTNSLWLCLFFLSSLSGCKVESVFLNIEAVNTHRDKPEVSHVLFLLCRVRRASCRTIQSADERRKWSADKSRMFCYFKLHFPDYTHKPSLTLCNIFTLGSFLLVFLCIIRSFIDLSSSSITGYHDWLIRSTLVTFEHLIFTLTEVWPLDRWHNTQLS